jgi:hypothetical protein
MRGLIGDLRIKTYLVNQNPAETCQVFGKNFSGQLYKKQENPYHRRFAHRARGVFLRFSQ